MAVLDTLSQFYAWSWIATIGALLLLVVFLVRRDARKQQPVPSEGLDTRFRRSLLARMLEALGVDPRAYAAFTGQTALAEQLHRCDGCSRRAACMQDLAYGQPELAECVNAQPIRQYLRVRS
ncbi:DUF6455 family protein [Algiphilus sp.]|uniref:DUF6455 family protein n=1 Tax=Algiphilus sp. TaxID=1872431 RepID=UPI001CA6C16E|nr:DUF6455 family protein [Algiphilus sp.]MBY8965216.1 hypothetical protein [Algiphilus acroporae]MCI5064038.1 DUF6455 family protein [Algiphilus sp.]MCI5104807.1 DUF6455 family protein [Algiphilus sp.]